MARGKSGREQLQKEGKEKAGATFSAAATAVRVVGAMNPREKLEAARAEQEAKLMPPSKVVGPSVGSRGKFIGSVQHEKSVKKGEMPPLPLPPLLPLLPLLPLPPPLPPLLRLPWSLLPLPSPAHVRSSAPSVAPFCRLVPQTSALHPAGRRRRRACGPLRSGLARWVGCKA